LEPSPAGTTISAADKAARSNALRSAERCKAATFSSVTIATFRPGSTAAISRPASLSTPAPTATS
jgi:hypothetical protein